MSNKENPQRIYWNAQAHTPEKSQMGLWAQERGFSNYSEFHQWSVQANFDFWKEWLKRSGIIFQGNPDRVFNPDPQGRFYGGEWFPDIRLNFAQNMLSNLSSTPLVHWLENGETQSWSKEKVLNAVALYQADFKKRGLSAGDVIAGILPHRPETLLAMLAASSLGIVWCTCSPDFGIQGILDRFSQVKPRLLLGVSQTEYNGKVFDLQDKNSQVAQKLGLENSFLDISTFNYSHQATDKLEFTPLKFNHPLYILFSSGTTGVPKCLIHSAGGSLLQHLKELKLHCDLKADEKIFYFTTCGWMMWNWVVSSLACGSELHCFEGSPSYPKVESLWERVQKNKIHVFGTSAKYISSCRNAGIKNISHDPALRLVLSTGSPLVSEDFDYFYSQISPEHNIQLASISGGTDIVSCFMLGTPLKNVIRGEIQCLGLGMDVKCFNDSGEAVIDQEGELVCTKVFPSMPVGFINDPDFKKYQSAYFERFKNIWHHGDYISITHEGGVVIQGRSDATLNPGGVRIGTAEIYRQVESVEAIKDSLVVGHSKQGDEEVILFVQLKDNQIFSEDLIVTLKKKIRSGASPRHVPSKIFEVKAIPYTLSGKKVELAVKNILAGREPKNIEALANPDCLNEFRKLKDFL